MAKSESTKLAPQGGIELLKRTGVQLVDLSMKLYEGMPIFHAHQRPFMMVNQTHEGWKDRYGTKVGFEAHNWLLSEHTGTHTDAVLEYVPGGASVEEMPLEYFYGPGICLDLTHVRHPDWITASVLEQAVAASPSSVEPGIIVLLYTAHGERNLPNPSYLTDQAGLSRDGAEWLANQGVVNIGIDAVSIDHSDDEDFIGHIVCGEYNIVNTENLINLDKLVGKEFTYFGLPLPLQKGTGSPVRAAAWITER